MDELRFPAREAPQEGAPEVELFEGRDDRRDDRVGGLGPGGTGDHAEARMIGHEPREVIGVAGPGRKLVRVDHGQRIEGEVLAAKRMQSRAKSWSQPQASGFGSGWTTAP